MWDRLPAANFTSLTVQFFPDVTQADGLFFPDLPIQVLAVRAINIGMTGGQSPTATDTVVHLWKKPLAFKTDRLPLGDLSRTAVGTDFAHWMYSFLSGSFSSLTSTYSRFPQSHSSR